MPRFQEKIRVCWGYDPGFEPIIHWISTDNLSLSALCRIFERLSGVILVYRSIIQVFRPKNREYLVIEYLERHIPPCDVLGDQLKLRSNLSILERRRNGN